MKENPKRNLVKVDQKKESLINRSLINGKIKKIIKHESEELELIIVDYIILL